MNHRTSSSRACLASTVAWVILGMTASLPTHAAGDPEDAKVNAWIAAAFEPKKRSAERDSNLARAMKPTVVMLAWQRLKRCRNSGNAKDLDLAAAEHYLFGRFVAGENGDTRYKDLPDVYETAKAGALKLGEQGVIQHAREPATPANKKVTEWGKKGMEKGLEDYEAWSGQKPAPGAVAWERVVRVTAYKYARYVGTDEPRCNVRMD